MGKTGQKVLPRSLAGCRRPPSGASKGHLPKRFVAEAAVGQTGAKHLGKHGQKPNQKSARNVPTKRKHPMQTASLKHCALYRCREARRAAL